MTVQRPKGGIDVTTRTATNPVSTSAKSPLVSGRKHLADCRILNCEHSSDYDSRQWAIQLSSFLLPRCKESMSISFRGDTPAVLESSDAVKTAISLVPQTDIVFIIFHDDPRGGEEKLIKALREANPKIYVVIVTQDESDVDSAPDLLIQTNTYHDNSFEAALNRMLSNDPIGAKGIKDTTKEEAKPAIAPSSARKINRVLVVDDEGIWRSILTNAVKNVGKEVTVAEDLESALKLLSEQKFDLVLTDRSKSSVNYGDDVALKAKELGIPCAMLSLNLPVQDLRGFKHHLGLCAFFQKGRTESDFLVKLIEKLEAGN
ncbi:MAG: response regulator [Candidatus Micrarchaeota archaeon]|nr:response regulator [Candidatus Micrarchaeota archaeon]